MRQVRLPLVGTIPAFRQELRRLIAANIPPDQVIWHRGGIGGGTGTDLFAAPATPLPDGPPIPLARDAATTIETALSHSDPERFALAHDIVLRLHGGTLRWGDPGDVPLRRITALAKAASREIHKMHAFVRFRELDGQARRRFAAWFEPDHPVTEAASPFFARRFGDMDWAIATPDITAIFQNGTLRFEPTADTAPPPADGAEELWRVYYRSIFNPARLNPRAMESEMPQKYWKNLPEAALIPQMIREAPARVQAMREAEIAAARPSGPTPRMAAVARQTAPAPAPEGGMDGVRHQAEGCTRCPLYAPATQTVWGEGPVDARLMLVGEQPGDQEDLRGRPFVGPAGQLLDRALDIAGLDRTKVWMTNAVKHFKFEPRGKRRIHQRPNTGEIRACKWWLDQELMLVQPQLVVAMGATAAQSLTGNGAGIMARRGTVEEIPDGPPVLLTLHPSYALRARSPEAREEAFEAIAEDLRRAAEMVA